MNDMAGQIVLVTGSTSGIGRAVALRLAESGATVAIHGRNAAAAEKVADAISRSAGSVAGIFLADIATPDGCTELLAAVRKTCPTLHAACLIAGADTLTGSSAATLSKTSSSFFMTPMSDQRCYLEEDLVTCSKDVMVVPSSQQDGIRLPLAWRVIVENYLAQSKVLSWLSQRAWQSPLHRMFE